MKVVMIVMDKWWSGSGMVVGCSVGFPSDRKMLPAFSSLIKNVV